MRTSVAKSDSIVEKKVLFALFGNRDLKSSEYVAIYNRDPEPVKIGKEIEFPDITPAVFSNWLIRGTRFRRFLKILGDLNHTLVVVPSGSTVTVEINNRKVTVKNIENEHVSVVAANESGKNLTVTKHTSERESVRNRNYAVE